MHIKICRKEAKECIYWLSLLDMVGAENEIAEQERLVTEATELRKIFGAIVTKFGDA